MTRVRKIISGGQTGADRGGLDAAKALGLKRGGTAPAGWRAEDGQIPVEYREGMLQSASASYRVRTRANIEASDGTLILSFGELPHDSGSYLTAMTARTLHRPLLHVNLGEDGHIADFGRQLIREWIEDKRIQVLNVAGPRESREPGLQAAVCAALVQVFSAFDHLTDAPEDAVFRRVAREMRAGVSWATVMPRVEPQAVSGVIGEDVDEWGAPR